MNIRKRQNDRILKEELPRSVDAPYASGDQWRNNSLSLIHFEFIFVCGVSKCSSFILLHIDVQFSQHHLLKRLSFLHCMYLHSSSVHL